MVDVMNGGVIDAYAPAHAAGTVDVTVTTTNGTSTVVTADQFTYVPIATTTTLTSSANPSTFGQSITLAVTVSNGTQGTLPGGQVEILDGGNVIATETLSGGQATFVTSALTAGGHTLSAAYQGDGVNAVSTSNTVNLTVQQASTTTTLTSSADPSTFGQAVTLTVR